MSVSSSVAFGLTPNKRLILLHEAPIATLKPRNAAIANLQVKSGLKAGELLVVRGAEGLRDGATVRIAAPGSTSDAPRRDGTRG